MPENDPERAPVPPEDARLTSLDERLRVAQQAEAVRTGQAKPVDKNVNLGNQVLSYLIGGLGGGAVIGWLLDSWLGTSPWLLLLLMALGTAAGFRSIIRISKPAPPASRAPEKRD